jgi:2-oxoisovalerate dehydrogenase E2 component (dihydrolipoyl transacylase)
MADIKMPQLGESVVEGVVAHWLKQIGDPIALHEAIVEIETDKINTEITAPAAGVLSEILVPAGTRVSVGTVVGRITQKNDALVPSGSIMFEEAATVLQPVLPSTEPPTEGTRPTRRIPGVGPISPVVAKLAAEHQLDLTKITGTGIGGRISKQDVLRYLGEPATPHDPGAAQGVRAEAHDPETLGDLVGTPTPGSRTLVRPETNQPELLPLTNMRRTIAEHLSRSVQSAPHVTTVFEVDLGKITAKREQERASFERQGVKLTFLPYIVQAVATGLRAVPVLNGRYTEQGIILNKQIHIGIAVALNDGLVVPVVRDVEEKSMLGLARAINDIAERARNHSLRPDEIQGGTFSITNHGVSGSLFATPIINQPQSAILGIGAIVKRPVVIEQHGIEAIAIRPMCYLSLTFDHRICDGADADRFLGVVKHTLEQ